MNLANKLTVIRIILVPVFVIFIAIKNVPYCTEIATAVFIIAALTDKLDGYIARSRNQVTSFGKLMDPLADKLLVMAALIALVDFHIIHAWVAVVILSREFLVTGLRTIAAAEGIVLAAGQWGKIKTVTQIVAVILALINIKYKGSFINIVTTISMGLAIVSTVFSGFDYFYRNKDLIKLDK